MTRSLLFLIAAKCLILSATAAAGTGDQPLVGCETRIQKTFQFPIVRLKNNMGEFPLDRINERTPITQGRAYSYFRIVSILPTESMPPEMHDACVQTASNLRAQLESFFERRFKLLLRQGNLTGFYSEYQTLLSNWGTRAERKSIGDRFLDEQSEYLRLSLEALKKELTSTRWSGYATITPSLELWNPEWAKILGGEAPGAVLFYARRIAVQASELDPASLKIVLFHELSHLADPRLKTHDGQDLLTAEQTETFAWGETMDYLSYLRREDIPIPDRFARDQQIIQKDGLAVWVDAIVASYH